MSFKKNAFSYFIWVLFMMCNLVVFSFLSMLCAKALGGPVLITAFGLVAAFFGVLFLIYFLTGYFCDKIYLKKQFSAEEKQMKSPVMDRFLSGYRKALEWALKYKAVVLVLALVLLIASTLLSVSKGYIFMP